MGADLEASGAKAGGVSSKETVGRRPLGLPGL